MHTVYDINARTGGAVVVTVPERTMCSSALHCSVVLHASSPGILVTRAGYAVRFGGVVACRGVARRPNTSTPEDKSWNECNPGL